MLSSSPRASQPDITSAAQGIRLRFLAWGTAMAMLLTVFSVVVLPRLKIETDILALLPATQDTAADDALGRLSNTLAQRQLYLIGSQNLEAAKQAAQVFATVLTASKQFRSVESQVTDELGSIVKSYQPHWPFLLSDRDRARLQSGASEELYREALRAAYTPSGMLRLMPLAQDPLGITGNFLQQQLPTLGNTRVDGSMLVATSGDRHYVLVTAETSGSVFSTSVQDPALLAVAEATRAASQSQSGIDIVSSGALQHAAAATRQAKDEIKTFGTIETVAVLALIFFIFGRMRPVILGLGILGLSITAAITLSQVIFGEVHILALVFGASLIGVVIDYSMHFCADQFRDQEHWTPTSALAHVGPAILLGAFTTVVGYLGLVFMPFPGLRQIAAFCIIGIIVGCGSVLCLYPKLMGSTCKPLPARGPRLATLFDSYLRQWQWTRLKLVLLLVLLAFLFTGALQVKVQDDIHALQASPAELVSDEARVREILSGGIETRFFLVQAVSEQAVLEREQQLRKKLDNAIRDGSLGSYLAMTRALPSLQQQQADHHLLGQTLYRDDGPFVRVMTQFGFQQQVINERLNEFRRMAQPLTDEAWLASPASEPYRHLWLGQVGGQFASVVTLSGIRNVAQMQSFAANTPGIEFIDRPKEVSNVMGRYRQVTSGLLIFANMTAFLIMCWRFGWRGAARLVLPSIAACIATLGIFGWLGVSFNLFNIFALLLVLALGIDYGIFLMHGRAARVTAILSVSLSACTTLIGFGMLAFSQTPFIRSIGVTLLVGILCSWVFVMLSCMTDWRFQVGAYRTNTRKGEKYD